MFPSMDGAIITEVLSAHGGNLDVASNVLLEMSDSSHAKGSTAGGEANHAHAQMSADEALARDLAWGETSPVYTGPVSQDAWGGASPAYAPAAQRGHGGDVWATEASYDVPPPPAGKPPSPPPIKSTPLPTKSASGKGHYERSQNSTPFRDRPAARSSSRDRPASSSSSRRNEDERRYDRGRNYTSQRSIERGGYTSRTDRDDRSARTESHEKSATGGSSGLRDWEEPRRVHVEHRKEPPRERLYPKPHASSSDARRSFRPRSSSPPLRRASAISAAPLTASHRSQHPPFTQQRKRNSLPPALPILTQAQADALLPTPYQPAVPFTDPLELVRENEQMRPKAALPSFGRSYDRPRTAGAGARGIGSEQQSRGTAQEHSPKISDVCEGSSSSSSSSNSGGSSDLLINTSTKRNRNGDKKDAQQAGSATALDHDSEISSVHTSLSIRGACDGLVLSGEPVLKKMRTASGGSDDEGEKRMGADSGEPAAKPKDDDEGELATCQTSRSCVDI